VTISFIDSWSDSVHLTYLTRFTGNRLKRGIVLQTIRIIGVFVSRNDLIATLSNQRQHVVFDVTLIPVIGDSTRHIRSQFEPMIELADQHQAGIARQRPAIKINAKFCLGIRKGVD
jgi:hypothetical protein